MRCFRVTFSFSLNPFWGAKSPTMQQFPTGILTIAADCEECSRKLEMEETLNREMKIPQRSDDSRIASITFASLQHINQQCRWATMTYCFYRTLIDFKFIQFPYGFRSIIPKLALSNHFFNYTESFEWGECRWGFSLTFERRFKLLKSHVSASASFKPRKGWVLVYPASGSSNFAFLRILHVENMSECKEWMQRKFQDELKFFNKNCFHNKWQTNTSASIQRAFKFFLKELCHP